MTDYVYELLDVTDDESYYPVGIWPTRGAAMMAIGDVMYWESDGYHDKYAEFQLFRRAVGFSSIGVGKVIAKKEFYISDDPPGFTRTITRVFA